MLDEALKEAKKFQPLCKAMYRQFGLYPSTDEKYLGEYLAYSWDIISEKHRGLNWINRCEEERKKNFTFDKLQEVTGLGPQEATDLLWDAYDPYKLWYQFAAIGLVSAVGMLLYSRWIKKDQSANA